MEIYNDGTTTTYLFKNGVKIHHSLGDSKRTYMMDVNLTTSGDYHNWHYVVDHKYDKELSKFIFENVDRLYVFCYKNGKEFAVVPYARNTYDDYFYMTSEYGTQARGNYCKEWLNDMLNYEIVEIKATALYNALVESEA